MHGARAIWHPDQVPIAFRAISRSDFPRVSRWLSAPHVAVWWRHPHDDAVVEAEFGPVVDGRDPTGVFIVEDDGHDVGLIQRYRLDDDPQWEQAVAVGSSPRPAVGIDYLIGEESRIGHGLGPRIIARFVDITWERFPDVVAVVVAVQQANTRSYRALEKAEFEREWSGVLQSVDPSDTGPSHVYVRLRPAT
jgi:aminoglycoside 6'-N-acetyltransferase